VFGGVNEGAVVLLYCKKLELYWACFHAGTTIMIPIVDTLNVFWPSSFFIQE